MTFSELLPSYITPFEGVPAWAIACVIASYFLGFFVRGAFGFGSNMPIVLLTTWLLGPHHAILLTAVAALAAQLHLLPQGIATADWKVSRQLIVGMLVGVGAGTWLFIRLAEDWLTLVMGALIITIVVLDRTRAVDRFASGVDLRSPVVTTSLAAGSACAGAVGGGGAMYLLSGFLKFVCASPSALRGTNLVVSGIFIFARIGFLSLAGLITPVLLIEAALLIPVVFLGTWAGTRFFRRAGPAGFYAALQTLLIAAALALIVKGAAQIW